MSNHPLIDQAISFSEEEITTPYQFLNNVKHPSPEFKILLQAGVWNIYKRANKELPKLKELPPLDNNSKKYCSESFCKYFYMIFKQNDISLKKNLLRLADKNTVLPPYLISLALDSRDFDVQNDLLPILENKIEIGNLRNEWNWLLRKHQSDRSSNFFIMNAKDKIEEIKKQRMLKPEGIQIMLNVLWEQANNRIKIKILELMKDNPNQWDARFLLRNMNFSDPEADFLLPASQVLAYIPSTEIFKQSLELLSDYIHLENKRLSIRNLVSWPVDSLFDSFVKPKGSKDEKVVELFSIAPILHWLKQKNISFSQFCELLFTLKHHLAVLKGLSGSVHIFYNEEEGKILWKHWLTLPDELVSELLEKNDQMKYLKNIFCKLSFENMKECWAFSKESKKEFDLENVFVQAKLPWAENITKMFVFSFKELVSENKLSAMPENICDKIIHYLPTKYVDELYSIIDTLDTDWQKYLEILTLRKVILEESKNGEKKKI
ncbi:DUF5691 domain-containing protein [Candidatus Uabimicrobium sp. HlEnr_7]|uniref:DUF5691 domain-containing protein n=1 Tax=Candidatus Uabimicrobium helgolandensis TaxID=3095367 RepID=UPI003557C50C